jgi:pyruvate kinase
VHICGNVLTKGRGLGNASIVGRTVVFRSSEVQNKTFHEGDILVATTTCDNMMNFIRKAGAVIVGSDQKIDTSHAEISCKALRKPLIICNDKVVDLIHEDITVTVDCEEGFVYNGVIK